MGGATGSIGDPSGRSSERNALSLEEVGANSASIKSQLELVFQNAKGNYNRHVPLQAEVQEVLVLDNLGWFKEMNMLDFVGDVGRFARVSTMLARDR